MNLQILTFEYLDAFRNAVKDNPLYLLSQQKPLDSGVDFHLYYYSAAAVFTSKMEGEKIDFEDYFEHRNRNLKYTSELTRITDDMFSALEFIHENTLSLANLRTAHTIFSTSFLPQSRQGRIRKGPIFMIGKDGHAEYIKTEPGAFMDNIKKLFDDIGMLRETQLEPFEVFYFAAFIHLMIVKMHPFIDGNGRAARLTEKWFLLEKLGPKATTIQLEKNYYRYLGRYISNLRIIGPDYLCLDYANCVDFLAMTTLGLKNEIQS